MGASERVEPESGSELIVDEVQPDLELLAVVAHEQVLHERGEPLFQPQVRPPLLEKTIFPSFR